MSFLYLASPYSKYEDGLDDAARLARANHGLLLSAGFDVFCPVSHAHDTPVNRRDYELWLRVDKSIAESAKALIVLKMKGWNESYGVGEEIRWFTEWGRPIIQMNPGEIPKPLMSIYA